MKGRRQARRAALQALYELDLTQHAVDTVLAGRTAAVFESGLDSVLPATARAVSRRVLALYPDGRPNPSDAAKVAARCGAAPADVAAVARVLAQLVPQVEYLCTLVHGVVANREVLDHTIERLAPEWPVAQMAPVDRNVLRIALWEISTGSSPTRVAINEAVELARTFSGEGARRMVNGALGTYVAGAETLHLSRDEPTPCPS